MHAYTVNKVNKDKNVYNKFTSFNLPRCGEDNYCQDDNECRHKLQVLQYL